VLVLLLEEERRHSLESPNNVYLLYQPNWANTEGIVLDKNRTADTVESLVIKINLVMLTSVKDVC